MTFISLGNTSRTELDAFARSTRHPDYRPVPVKRRRAEPLTRPRPEETPSPTTATSASVDAAAIGGRSGRRSAGPVRRYVRALLERKHGRGASGASRATA